MISILDQINLQRMNRPSKNGPPIVVHPAPWPIWATLISKRRQDGETGVGDTIQRLFSYLGADKLAHIFEHYTGKSCGCTNRQILLNQKYPYSECSQDELVGRMMSRSEKIPCINTP